MLLCAGPQPAAQRPATAPRHYRPPLFPGAPPPRSNHLAGINTDDLELAPGFCGTAVLNAHLHQTGVHAGPFALNRELYERR